MRLALCLMAATACVASAGWAAPPTLAAPTLVIELFTSKYCPNCPATEKHFAKEAAANPTWLLLQQHVDYWDRGPQKDPYGLAEATQRQYDYSNKLSRRAGEVFTPMPVLNGLSVAPPPLFINWDKAKLKADTTPPKPLNVTLNAATGLTATAPAGINAAAQEAWAMGTETMHSPGAQRVRAIVPMELSGGVFSLPPALVPKTAQVWVLVQGQGNGPLVAVGRAK